MAGNGGSTDRKTSFLIMLSRLGSVRGTRSKRCTLLSFVAVGSSFLASSLTKKLRLLSDVFFSRFSLINSFVIYLKRLEFTEWFRKCPFFSDKRINHSVLHWANMFPLKWKFPQSSSFIWPFFSKLQMMDDLHFLY